jgi:hypothetical protein
VISSVRQSLIDPDMLGLSAFTISVRVVWAAVARVAMMAETAFRLSVSATGTSATAMRRASYWAISSETFVGRVVPW